MEGNESFIDIVIFFVSYYTPQTERNKIVEDFLMTLFVWNKRNIIYCHFVLIIDNS